MIFFFLFPANALTTGNYFLDSGSSRDFLDNNSPTAAAAKVKDAPAINRTAFKMIGTWVAVIADRALTLVALSDLHTWLGLETSGDVGRFFDVMEEVLKNGV